MFKTKIAWTIMAALLLLPCIAISEESQPEIIEVVATGIGKDSDGALKNALRAAIEQTVGTMVNSETLIENDEIVNDQILNYSAGFVQSHKVIGEPGTSDGLVTIKISAQVKKSQLVKKLEAADIHTAKMDGESLFGEVITKIEQKQSAAELVARELKGFPENILAIQMDGKPQYDEETRKISIGVEISIDKDAYKTFSKNLNAILGQVSEDKERLNFAVEKDRYKTASTIRELDKFRGKRVMAVGMQVNDELTNSIWEVANVSQEVIDAARNAVSRPYFTVEIVDEEDDPIVAGRYDCPVPYGVNGMHNEFAQNSSFIVHPLLQNNPNTAAHIEPGRESGIWNVSFSVSANEIKKMRNVICKIVPRKR